MLPPRTMRVKMELPNRKHPRLKEYDYSLPGYYYVTIHVEKNSPVLSAVGRGLAPAEAKVTLTEVGRIAQEQLFLLERRYSYVKIDKYVIMPTHIHAIIVLDETAGASPRPTLSDVICTYKSLATRELNRALNIPGRKLFQASFYESVLRNEKAYQKCWNYIDGNPGKWLENTEEKEWNEE